MAAIDAVLLATFENGMLGHDSAKVQDADQVGQLLDFDDTPGAIGHAVVVAADRDEAVVADAPFEFEHGVEAVFGQGLQLGLLGGKSLGDDTLGGAVDADVGNGVEPVDQLKVQIVEVAESAAEEEVLTDIAERPLDFALGLGPVWPAGARLEAVVPRQREQRPVVDNVADIVLAGHRRLHAVVEDLDRHTVQRRERLDMAAEKRLQVLVQDIAREDEAGVAEHQAEQPDDPAAAGVVGEVDDKSGEINLRLNPGRCLEAHLIWLGSVLGTDRGEVALHRRVGTAHNRAPGSHGSIEWH